MNHPRIRLWYGTCDAPRRCVARGGLPSFRRHAGETPVCFPCGIFWWQPKGHKHYSAFSSAG